MRFMWLLPMFKAWYKGTSFELSQSDATILALVEALRRAQWALIRIENENVNNFERYRNVLQIPEFKDMVYGKS
jgi:septin family protein